MNFKTVFYPSFEWGGKRVGTTRLFRTLHIAAGPPVYQRYLFFLHNYLPEPDFVILTNCVSSTARVRPQRETIHPFSLQSSGRHVIA